MKIALINKDTVSPEDAMANADIACYIAKGKGRNQTHLYNKERDEKGDPRIVQNAYPFLTKVNDFRSSHLLLPLLHRVEDGCKGAQLAEWAWVYPVCAAR